MNLRFIFFIYVSFICLQPVFSKTTEIRKINFDDTLKFRIIDVPVNDSNYLRIIERGKSVTMHSGRVYLKPGENVGEHSTEDYEELVIILKGTGEVENKLKERFQIKEGQVIYIPPDSTHNVFNTGTEPLIYIYVVAKTR